MLSDELSLRVGQLGSARTRARLASALRRAVQLANLPPAPLVATRLRRAEIQANHELLLALADRLQDGEPLGVQGLALTARLVDRWSSPLYRRSDPLAATLLAALDALERAPRTARAV